MKTKGDLHPLFIRTGSPLKIRGDDIRVILVMTNVITSTASPICFAIGTTYKMIYDHFKSINFLIEVKSFAVSL